MSLWKKKSIPLSPHLHTFTAVVIRDNRRSQESFAVHLVVEEEDRRREGFSSRCEIYLQTRKSKDRVRDTREISRQTITMRSHIQQEALVEH